jgi:hypothetical protein
MLIIFFVPNEVPVPLRSPARPFEPSVSSLPRLWRQGASGTLYQRLVADGIDPWLDEKKLLPGQEWETEIADAVRTSYVVLVCLSRSSITKSGFVQKEIRFASDTAD